MVKPPGGYSVWNDTSGGTVKTQEIKPEKDIAERL